MVTVLDNKITDALIDERRRLNKQYKTLNNMLRYMDIEDIEKVLVTQHRVKDLLTEIDNVLAPLN